MPRQQLIAYIVVIAVMFVGGVVEGFYLDEIVSFLHRVF